MYSNLEKLLIKAASCEEFFEEFHVVVKVLSILLVMPITNAISERSFSALRIKTYLKTTMHRACLNHLMLLHVDKYIKDKLDLIECANDFVAGSDTSLFGKFVS